MVERWAEYNDLELMQQLGVVPSPERSEEANKSSLGASMKKCGAEEMKLRWRSCWIQQLRRPRRSSGAVA